MKRKMTWVLLAASAAVLRLGLECLPNPDLVDPLNFIVTGLFPGTVQ